jgi:hypothetical protein
MIFIKAASLTLEILEQAASIGPEGIAGGSISGDLAGQKADEGSSRGNRQNVFERGCSGGKRILRSDLQNRG